MTNSEIFVNKITPNQIIFEDGTKLLTASNAQGAAGTNGSQGSTGSQGVNS